MSWTPERIQHLKNTVDANQDLRDILLSLLIATRGQHGESGALDEMRWRAGEVLGLQSHRPSWVGWEGAAEIAEKLKDNLPSK